MDGCSRCCHAGQWHASFTGLLTIPQCCSAEALLSSIYVQCGMQDCMYRISSITSD